MVPVTVQQLFGHASIEMTVRDSHPGANEIRKVVALLSDGHHRRFRGNLPGCKFFENTECAPVAQVDRATVS